MQTNIKTINLDKIQDQATIFQDLANKLYYKIQAPDFNLAAQFKVLAPVLLQKQADNFLLLDGFKRLAYLKSKGATEISALVISPDATTYDIARLVLLERFQQVNDSLLNKIYFLDFCVKLGLSDADFSLHIFPLLGLEYYLGAVNKYLSILKASSEFLNFCADKQFSLKQIQALLIYKNDLLKTLLPLKDKLNLSASIFLELAENINDICRKEDLKLTALFKEEELQQLLDSTEINNQKRTQDFRFWLKKRRFPVLTQAQDSIKQELDKLHLPKQVTIYWDHTLEKKEIQLSVLIKKVEEWQVAKQFLNQAEFLTVLGNVLKQL